MNWAVLAIAALVAVFLIAPLYPLNAEYPTIFIETPGPIRQKSIRKQVFL